MLCHTFQHIFIYYHFSYFIVDQLFNPLVHVCFFHEKRNQIFEKKIKNENKNTEGFFFDTGWYAIPPLKLFPKNDFEAAEHCSDRCLNELILPSMLELKKERKKFGGLTLKVVFSCSIQSLLALSLLFL